MWLDYCAMCDKQCPQGAMYCSAECRAKEEARANSFKYVNSLYCDRSSKDAPSHTCTAADCEYCQFEVGNFDGPGQSDSDDDDDDDEHISEDHEHLTRLRSAQKQLFSQFRYPSPLLEPQPRGKAPGSPPPSPLLISSSYHSPHQLLAPISLKQRPPELPPAPRVTPDQVPAAPFFQPSAVYREWLSSTSAF